MPIFCLLRVFFSLFFLCGWLLIQQPSTQTEKRQVWWCWSDGDLRQLDPKTITTKQPFLERHADGKG
jgi:hypothetical protein